MSSNYFQLNNNFSNSLLLAHPHSVQSASIAQLAFDSEVISLSYTVTNVGVQFDSHLTYDKYIKQLYITSFYHLGNIYKPQPHFNHQMQKSCLMSLSSVIESSSEFLA